MKLGKLLNASTSIFGGGEPLSYRLNQGGLPKFNAGRNPFATKTAEEAPEQIRNPKSEIRAVAEVETRSGKESSPSVQPAPPPDVFKPAAKPVAQPVAQPMAKPAKQGWATRLNPFRAPEPAQPTQVVQAELSLNSVKVVHNDLTDADVEVVPVKSHADAVAAPVLPPARRAWEYLGESLLNH